MSTEAYARYAVQLALQAAAEMDAKPKPIAVAVDEPPATEWPPEPCGPRVLH